MSHSTVTHKWFHQIGNLKTNRNEFSSGSMFYHRKIVYSYGKHFAIAIRFNDTVVFNSKGYSNSTAKHKNHVWNAIDSYKYQMHVYTTKQNKFVFRVSKSTPVF